MIARTEGRKEDVWAKIAAPLPPTAIQWRQDGKPVQRDGRYVARFVAFTDANTVRERLDSVVPGEWDLTLDLLPHVGGAANDDGEPVESFKARLQILGVIREDVGTGSDYKSAATDAFKRAAVRFGIGHELYGFEQNWVQVDGDGRYAKALEDPGTVYARRQTRTAARASGAENGSAVKSATGARSGGDGAGLATQPESPPPAARQQPAAESPLATDEPSCPKCGGRMWDNRLSKRNPKAPDFKCRNRSCDGCVWPAKEGDRQRDDSPRAAPARSGAAGSYGDIDGLDEEPPPPDDNDIPF